MDYNSTIKLILSFKRKLLIALEKEIISKRRALHSAVSVLGSEEEEEEDMDDKSDATIECDSTIDKLITEGLEEAHFIVSNRRYAFPRKPYRKGYKRKVFDRDLEEDDKEDGTPHGFQTTNF